MAAAVCTADHCQAGPLGGRGAEVARDAAVVTTLSVILFGVRLSVRLTFGLGIFPAAALAGVLAGRAAAALRAVLVLVEAFARLLETLVLVAVFFAT